MKNILICLMLLFMLTGCNKQDSSVLVTEKNGEKTSKIEQEFTLETADIITSELITSVNMEVEPIITTSETGVSNKLNYANREGVVVTKEQALARISTISFNNVVEENLNKFFFLTFTELHL